MTTQTLVPIYAGEIAGNPAQVVSARELHTFLENGDMFANWIQDRIEQYDFVENQDFISFLENSKKPQGGRSSKEYHITLDMAKELSMVERNEKGKQARRYFIQCEKALHNHRLLSALTPQDYDMTLDEFYQWKKRLRFEINAAIEEVAKKIHVNMCGYDYLDLIAGKDTPAIKKLIGGSHD